MAKVTPVLWVSKKPNAAGEHPIYLRLEADRRRLYFSLRIKVKRSFWNKKSGSVRETHRRHAILNRIIKQNVRCAEDEIYRLLEERRPVTPESIKNALKGSGRSTGDFLAYADAYSERFRMRGKIPTYTRYRSIFRKLRAFAGGALPFTRLTKSFLYDYQEYMLDVVGNTEGTVASNLKPMRAVINQAIRDGVMNREDSPFIDFRIRDPRPSKRKLRGEEIAALIKVDLDPGSQHWHARNIFLFSFYTAGVRFRDVCTLRIKNVSGGRLSYTMSKTGTPKDIPIVPQAEEILACYATAGAESDRLVFPLISGYNISTPELLTRAIASRNARMNLLLKEVAQMAGIDPGLTYHMSRHSFADYARRNGMEIMSVSRALGHRNLGVTEGYLKGFDHDFMDDEFRRLFNR